MGANGPQAHGDICEVGRRLYLLGFVAAAAGNISTRIGDDRVLCTPTGVSKGFMTEEMLGVCDLEGNKVVGDLEMSSEILMHLEIYKVRRDVDAVVHAHPPTATGFAAAGLDLPACVLPEIVVGLGAIPLAPYGTPGGPEIFEPMRSFVEKHDAVLLANHGAVALGRDVMDAHFKMEMIEHFARIALVSHQLGGANTLTREQVAELAARFGHPARTGGLGR